MRFLEALWGPPEAGRVYDLRLIGTGGTRKGAGPSAASVVKVAGKAEDGQNVYFGVAPRRADAGPGGKANVACVGAVWADLDADVEPEEGQARIRQFPIEPSAWVRSGHGYHAYWLLSEMVGPEGFERIERLNKAIAAMTGSDKAVSDVSRIMRMPGTFNWKGNDCRSCWFVDLPEGDLKRYELVELEKCVQLDRAAPKEVCKQGAGMWTARTEGSRNEGCFLLASRLQREGASQDAALAAARAWNESNNPPLPDSEVQSAVKSAYRGKQLAPATVADSDCWEARELTTMQAADVDWTVEGLVPTRGVTILSGEGGIGKSFVALDMGLAVASGGLFAGQFQCAGGPVLYVDLENDEGTIGRRLSQLAAGRGLKMSGLPMFIPKRGHPGVALQLDTAAGRAWLSSAVELHKPKLVVVDSLIAAHSGDENNNVLMRQLMSGMDAIARDGNLALLVVHHQRKRGVVNDAGQAMRGASDIRNAVVSHLAARRLRDDLIICEHDKCRPARPCEPFTLRLSDNEGGGVVVEIVAQGLQAKAAGNRAMERSDIVLQRLEQGACRAGELYELLACPERTALRTIKDMVNQGRIFKWPDGMYRLTDGGEP